VKRIVLLLPLTLAACSDPRVASETAEAHGFRVVRVEGYSPFSCGKDDTFSTGLTLRAQTGQCVRAVVCSGLFFKGATLRVLGQGSGCPTSDPALVVPQSH
jgi:hypothetical protein